MKRLRVASYNIAGATNDDNRVYSRRGNRDTARRTAHARRALDRIAQLLSQEQIDIAALQEVDVCHNGSDSLHQAEHLASELRMTCAYAPSFDYDLLRRISVTTGLATLASLPLGDSRALELPQARLSWKRRLKARMLGSKKALHATYHVGSRELHVVNAHLTHNSDRQKELELQFLLDRCARLPVALLMGDLNTTPQATRHPGMVEGGFFASDGCMDLLRRFRDQHPDDFQCDARLAATLDGPGGVREICTYPAEKASIKLDYILLVSRDGGVSLGPERILDLCTSNHRPVRAELSLEE